MKTIYNGSVDTIILYWKIMRGENKVTEDLSNLKSRVFLIGSCNTYSVTPKVVTDEEFGNKVLRVEVDASILRTGVYDVKAVWEKNDGRNIMKSARTGVFAITDNSEEVDEIKSEEVIRIASYVESIGRDGLSAYEIAVIKGLNNGLSENDWVGNEAGRIVAEQEREIAETTRKENETARENAESSRQSRFNTFMTESAASFSQAQTNRDTDFTQAQEDREAAFTDKIQDFETRFNEAEASRNNGEGRRNQSYAEAEDKRDADYATAEANRNKNYNQAEEERDSTIQAKLVEIEERYTTAEAARRNLFTEAETERDAKEDDRAAAEDARQSRYNEFMSGIERTYDLSEEARQKAFEENEEKREKNEQIREESEAARIETFSENEGTYDSYDDSRWGIFNTNEAQRDTQEHQRITEEEVRRSNEVERIANETERQNAEAIRQESYQDKLPVSAVVQETGDGENVVMSQKAVSGKLGELESKAILNYDGRYAIAQKVVNANVHKMIIGGCIDIEYDESLSYQFASIVNSASNRIITLYSKLKDVSAEEGITYLLTFVVNPIIGSPYYMATSAESPNSFLILDFKEVQTINNIYDYDGVGLSPRLFKGGVVSTMWSNILSVLATSTELSEVVSGNSLKLTLLNKPANLPSKSTEALFIDRTTGKLKPATGLSSVVKLFDVSFVKRVRITTMLPGNIYCGQFCFYDADKNPISSPFSGVEDIQSVTYENVVVPNNAVYLYVSAENKGTDVDVFASDILSEFAYQEGKEDCYTSSDIEGKINITIGKQSFCKNNYIIGVHLTFDEFSDIQIRKGTSSDYVPSYFKITDTDIEWYQGNSFVKKYTHGLTISKYIQFIWDTDELMKTKVTIHTDGEQSYTIENIVVYAHGTLQLVGATNMHIENAYIKYKNIRSDIRMYGDSYYQHEDNRFPYYLLRRGGNFFLNSLPGGKSSQLYDTLVNDIELAGLPKIVVWGLGMNDNADVDVNTPDATWLGYVNKIIQLCGNRCELVLCTIPSIPSKSHEGKNKWIRNSGHRFIDFAAAVENGINTEWKYGMINESQDHPSKYGARTMADRAVVDLPELIKV